MKTVTIDKNDYKDSKTKLVISNQYRIEYDNENYYIVRKYPADIIDCCDILEIGYEGYVVNDGYMCDTFSELRKLKICIDAFDKLFEGEYPYIDKKYIIAYNNGEIITSDKGNHEYFLSFYTEESRDYFLNSFRKTIEKCSSFLYNIPNIKM